VNSRTPSVSRLLFRLIVGSVYVLLVAPVLVVVLVSFNPVESLTVRLSEPSLRWYQEFFRNSTFNGAFVTSLQVASLSALGSTVLGLPAAYGIVRFRFPLRNSLQLLFLAPVIVPTVILGVALLMIYFSIGLRGSILTVAIAHIVITTPYVIRTVSASLTGTDPQMEEAAMGLGAGRLRTFWSITLPLMRSGVIAGALFSFVLSFGELNATIFLTSPQVTTLPVQIFAELAFTTNPVVAAASVLQVLVIVVAVLLMEYTIGITRAARF